jgi:tetraacyldisaccharide-1-P 4'-kinase
LPDHHEFTPADVEELSLARPSDATSVTTEKDFQRLKAVPAHCRRLLLPLAVVRIRMEILSGERYLDAALAAAVGAGSPLSGPADGR